MTPSNHLDSRMLEMPKNANSDARVAIYDATCILIAGSAGGQILLHVVNIIHGPRTLDYNRDIL